MSGYVSDAVIRRLPAYYRHLRELDEAGVVQISSQDLGEKMRLTPSQIRQDINSFGGFGRQGYGYDVKELKEHIRELMGINREHRMAIIGAGRVGQAIANHIGFRKEGFIPVGMFDIFPGKNVGGDLSAFSVEELEERLPDMDVSIAVLAVPAEAAQEMLDRAYRLGVRAFWNFAPVDLSVPRDAVVVSAHLIDSLFTLGYRMEQPE